VPGGVETCASVVSHPAFGPVVSFGLGGAFAEMIADRPARSLPLTDLDAAELVSSSRAVEALTAMGVEVAAMADLLVRLGEMADHLPELDQARLNPILVSPGGIWVLDAVLHVAPPPAAPLDAIRGLF
jgi:hypothetical protein